MLVETILSVCYWYIWYLYVNTEKTFCSDGYFAFSVGNVSKEMIEKYIQSKG